MTDELNVEAMAMAREICAASDKDLSEIFYQLLRQRQLSDTVRGLNQLLCSSQHSSLAMASLHRLGLAQCG